MSSVLFVSSQPQTGKILLGSIQLLRTPPTNFAHTHSGKKGDRKETGKAGGRGAGGKPPVQTMSGPSEKSVEIWADIPDGFPCRPRLPAALPPAGGPQGAEADESEAPGFWGKSRADSEGFIRLRKTSVSLGSCSPARKWIGDRNSSLGPEFRPSA